MKKGDKLSFVCVAKVGSEWFKKQFVLGCKLQENHFIFEIQRANIRKWNMTRRDCLEFESIGANSATFMVPPLL